MASKSSTSNDEDDDDYGAYFIPWLDLIFGVDNTSTDLLLSNEELLTERYLKAGTLPSILRRMTLIETTSQSQIWAFLLHAKLFIQPRHIFTFLMKRFHLSPIEVDHYAESLRNEVYDSETSNGLLHDPRSSDERSPSTGPYGPDIMEEDRHVIGPQYFWLASSAELSLHSDELSKRSLSLFCERDDMDRLMLESYSSIQLGVLLFLETWLQHFPEDFLLVAARVHSKFSRKTEKSAAETSKDFEFIHEFPRSPDTSAKVTEDQEPIPPSQWTDDSDDTFLTAELIEFLREFSTSSLFFFLGGKATKTPEKDQSSFPEPPLKRAFSNQELASIWIPQGSQLKIHFPCLSTVFEIIVSDDSLSSLVKQVISLPSPTDHSQENANRQSARVSFFEKFIDSRLSDILEFEDDTLSILASETESEFRSDFATKLLTSCLGPEARLSNGCTDNETFPVKIPCPGGVLNCIISSSLVSAMTASSIELRSKFFLTFIAHSQCHMHLEKQWNSEEFFSLDNNLLENLHSDEHVPAAAVTFATTADVIADPPTLSSQPTGTDDSESGDPNPENIQLFSPISLEKQRSIPLSLLEKLTKGIQILKEKPMVDVYVAYSECAITLCAVELQIAQDYVLSESFGEVPLRVFSTAIDRQIIGFSGSKKKGLDQVANVLRRHRSHTLSDSEIGSVSITSRDSFDSKGPQPATATAPAPAATASAVATAGGNKSPQRVPVTSNSLRRSMFSFLRRASTSESIEEGMTAAATTPSSRSSLSGPPTSRLSLSSTATATTSAPTSSSSATKVLPTHLSSLSSELMSQSLFLSHDDKTIANNLTLRFHYLFCTIPLYEFSIDYSFTKNHKDTPMLNRFRLESDKLQEFVGNQILLFDDLMVRAEVIIQIIRVAELLARQRSHHVLMMLVFSLQSHSIHRLKTTWAVVHARIPGRWDILQDLIGFGGQKLTTNFCSRQSVEGVTEDIREHLKLTIPSHLPLSESLTDFLDSNDVKTLQVTHLPEGKSLSFGILASKEAYPTKGGLSNSNLFNATNTRHSIAAESSLFMPSATVTTTANRSCSYVDLQKSTQHESSSHWLSSLQDTTRPTGTRGGMTGGSSKVSVSTPAKLSPPAAAAAAGDGDGDENTLVVKRQFPSPVVLRLKPKFVLKRRSSFPLSRKEISKIKHAIQCHEILDFTQTLSEEGRGGGRGGEEGEAARGGGGGGGHVSANRRSSSTNTYNLSHVFGPERPQLRRMRTLSEVMTDHHDGAEASAESEVKEMMTREEGEVEGERKIENDGSSSSLLHANRPIHQYRQYLLEKLFAENRPVYGTVKSDGLGEAGGTPKASGKPCLPYVNGILGRIIRLKEIPSFIKTEIHNPTSGQPVGCYYCAQSPGNSVSDPFLPLINFGKLRAISNLLILLRSSQMTPYKFEIDFEIQYLCAKVPLYHGEDAMWERSKALE